MNFLKLLISFTLLFLVAFDPKVPLMPNGVGFTLIITILLFPVVCWKISSKPNIYISLLRKTSPYFIAYSFALFLILFRLLLNQGSNLEFVLSWLKAFLVFLSCFSVYVLFFAHKPPRFFISSLLSIYVVNALINFIAPTFPNILSFVSFFQNQVISENLGLNPYRNSFISGSGYFSIGTAYGLIAILFSFYLSKIEKKAISSTLSLLLISITGFIAARTAFFAIFAAYIYLLKSRIIYSFFLLIGGGFFSFLLLQLPKLNPYQQWLLSFFQLDGNSTVSTLVDDMYFWPGSMIFLVGYGATNDGTYIYTDGGYMLDILFGGILFLASKLSFVFIFLYQNIKRYTFFTILICLAILVFHFKGLFIYNNAQGMAAFYFIIFYLISISYRTTHHPKKTYYNKA